MPLYEYECPACGTFERVQKFSDPILTVCPTCERPVEKLLSAPAIQFKGSGWYVTDYAGKGKDGDRQAKGKEDAGKGKEKAASDTTSGDAKTESSTAVTSSGADKKQP